MVASKKKRNSDPFAALQKLLEDPGSNETLWEDLWASTTDDPIAKIVLALTDTRYDDRAAAIIYGAMLEHALQISN